MVARPIILLIYTIVYRVLDHLVTKGGSNLTTTYHMDKCEKIHDRCTISTMSYK